MLSKIVYISSFVMGAVCLVASVWLFFIVALTDPLTSMYDVPSPGVARHASTMSNSADATFAFSGSTAATAVISRPC